MLPVRTEIIERSLAERERAPLATRPPAPAAATFLKVALGAFLAALALLFLVVALVVAVLVIRLSHAGPDLATGVGQTVQDAGRSIAAAAGALVQESQDARDPLHPPRYAIQQDPRFDQLRVFQPGDILGEAGGYRYAIGAIAERSDVSDPLQRTYARIHRALITPKVTSLFGITIRRDDDARDYALYQGQQFTLNGRDYKVNWLSSADNQLSAVRFRDEGTAPGPFVFVGGT